MKLSILIPTVPSRFAEYLPKILNQISSQIADTGRNDVELIVLYDNKKRTIGAKRNELVRMAQGEYVVFIDDDDAVSDDYVALVLSVIDSHPEADCIVYDSTCVLTKPSGVINRRCVYGIEYDYFTSPDGLYWTGKPAHTMVYRASIAKAHSYENISEGEDMNWVARACKDIKVQARIDKVMYIYYADYRKSER